jgi:serine/threonine protein kinase
MEFCDGLTLKEQIKQMQINNSKPILKTILDVFVQIASGIQYLHVDEEDSKEFVKII